jgi:GMP synthase (glutamine-hydrolysing)
MILVLDFGSQYTQLIARRIREFGVFSEIKPCTINPSDIDLTNVSGLILSGGPASVNSADAPKFNPDWLKINKPILGICYGLQLISKLFGAKLSSGEKREYGIAKIKILEDCPLLSGLNKSEDLTVWMSHGDHVDSLPDGFKLIASSQSVPVAIIASAEKNIYAMQFHPEVVHSLQGKDILKNFVFNICSAKADWTTTDFIDRQIEHIRTTVGESAQVICGLSGGVDSTVAAVLVDKALGDRLTCIFVDNGLLRKNEAEEVYKSLGPDGLGLNIKVINAADIFLKELKGVSDPEQKRKIIGRVFIEVFDKAAHEIQNVTHLVQGTLYPDVIESLSVKGPSATIKTHHNVGGLPERMKLKLIEPFRELFKDEVRALGIKLGVPELLIKRHPFPGPGLAVRILGDITEERLKLVRESDAIFMEEIKSAGIYNDIWQAFTVLLPVQSVGVMGDNRTYEQAIALRAVTSEDGMTADWAYLPHQVLQRTSNRIINEVRGINRVVLDVSSKPPATIEWE